MTALDKLSALQSWLKDNPRPKAPRIYAEEIYFMKTREERNAALNKVPEDIRGLVEFYVKTHFAKRDGKPLPDYKGDNKS